MKGEGRERAAEYGMIMRKRERKVRKNCRKEKREKKRKEFSMTLIFFSSSFF
jgi:hypothetical protein